MLQFQLYIKKKPQNKSSCTTGPTTKALPPSSLVVNFFFGFFLELQKKLFFISGSAPLF